MSSRLSFHNNVLPAPEESTTYSRSQSRRRDQSRDTSISGVSSTSVSVSQDKTKRSRRQRVKEAFSSLFGRSRSSSPDAMAGKIERIKTAERERVERWRSMERSRTPQRDPYIGL